MSTSRADRSAETPPPTPRVMVRCALAGAGRSPRDRRLAQALVLSWVRSKWPRLLPTPEELAQEQFQRVLSDRRLSIGNARDGAVWTLEVAYDERDGARTWTTRVMVADTGVVDVVGLQTTCTDRAGGPMVVAPPKVLGAWVDRLELLDGCLPVLGAPRSVEDDDQLSAFLAHLASPERSLPIVALANRSQSRYYGVDPAGLAESLRGLAHVVCLTPAAAAAVQQQVGKHLAPLAGAARIYRPGFDPDADPREHALVRDHRGGEAAPAPSAFRRLLCHRVCAISAATLTRHEAVFESAAA